MRCPADESRSRAKQQAAASSASASGGRSGNAAAVGASDHQIEQLAAHVDRLAGGLPAESVVPPDRPAPRSRATAPLGSGRQRSLPRSLPLTCTISLDGSLQQRGRVRLGPGSSMMARSWPSACHSAWQMCGTIGDEREHRDLERLVPRRRSPTSPPLAAAQGVKQLHDRGNGRIEGAPAADIDRDLGQRLVRRRVADCCQASDPTA